MNRERFYDEVKIYVKGGKGGDGCLSFRRERGVPRGGPDGGDGGDGGEVTLKVSKRVATLIYFHYKKHFVAERGRGGQGKNKKGRRGEDIVLEVPRGTLLKDEEGNLLKDLKEKGDLAVVARGGRGGRGNTAFKSATYQAPRITEKGEDGKESWINLELKLIADVGIIGLPNAGKSTLLARISSAHPKIAPYPFTTLRPYLGIVKVDEFNSFVAADLPGLIEEASQGKGLGDRFLRHIERSKLLLHLVDVGEELVEDPLGRFHIILRELKQYNPALLSKPQLVVANKLDLPGAHQKLQELENGIGDAYAVIGISCKTGAGIPTLITTLAALVREEKDKAG